MSVERSQTVCGKCKKPVEYTLPSGWHHVSARDFYDCYANTGNTAPYPIERLERSDV